MLIKTEGNIVDLYIMGNLCSKKRHSYSVSVREGQFLSTLSVPSEHLPDSSAKKPAAVTREPPQSTVGARQRSLPVGGFKIDPVRSSFTV